MVNKVSVTIGWSFFIAGFISYILNGFWWSVVHAFCGWIYLIYVIIFRHSELIPAFKTYFGIESMKYTLLASSFEFGPTGIQKLISQYYFGSTVILNLISENEWSISNSKGLIENVRVIKKGSRYRFERKEK